MEIPGRAGNDKRFILPSDLNVNQLKHVTKT